MSVNQDARNIAPVFLSIKIMGCLRPAVLHSALWHRASTTPDGEHTHDLKHCLPSCYVLKVKLLTHCAIQRESNYDVTYSQFIL